MRSDGIMCRRLSRVFDGSPVNPPLIIAVFIIILYHGSLMSLTPELIQQAADICKYVLVEKVWEEEGFTYWMWAFPRAVKAREIGSRLGCWKARMEGWWDTRCVFSRDGSGCPAGPEAEAGMLQLKNKESCVSDET